VIRAMRAECPGVDLRAAHRKFTDYWRAKSGQAATKVDWVATWRNWIRTEAERGPHRNGRSIDSTANIKGWMARKGEHS
jgi:hypothetical protein